MARFLDFELNPCLNSRERRKNKKWRDATELVLLPVA